MTDSKKAQLEIPKRALEVLEALKDLGVQEGQITQVSWQKLIHRTEFGSKDLVYGLVKLLLAQIIRFRLVAAKPPRLYVSMCSQISPKLPYERIRTNVTNVTDVNVYKYINTLRTDERGGEVNGKVLGETWDRGGEGSLREEEKDSENLAERLARELGESDRLSYYRRLVESFPEAQIENALNDCLKIPAHKIFKNRAALFKSILNRYAKHTN